MTGWQITRRDSGADLGYIRYGNRDHTFSSHGNLNVEPSTTYMYTIHAINDGGHGARSEEITVTTLAPVDWTAREPTPGGQ